MKIWLQFTRIEEYLLGFFLGVHLMFKGRIRSNQAMNHDESCLNLIAIESRMQGNHDELKICLQNFLIASRLIKSWVTKRGRTPIYRGKNLWKLRTVRFGEDRSTAMIAHWSWATIPRSHDADPGSPLISPVRSWSGSPRDATCCKVGRRSRSLKSFLTHVLWWWSSGLQVHRIDALHLMQLHPTRLVLPRVLQRRG